MKQINVPSAYALYLETPEFNALRQKIFDRDGHKCIVCGSTENIQVHHLTYRNVDYSAPGSENDRDLITLCRNCHAIYHNVNKRREYVENTYKCEEMRERREDWAQEEKRRNELNDIITREIQEEYLDKDYCRNGDLDMCNWQVLNAVIDSKCKKHGLNYYSHKTELRNWFCYRRYALLLRCLDKGIPLHDVITKTKFDSGWLAKWYRRDKLEAKLNEEKAITEG